MDKIKEKLHIGSSSSSNKKATGTEIYGGPDNGHVGTIDENRDSIDSELASMPPQERVAYLKEFEDSDKHDTPKKGGLLEKLIARGNKRTEEQIERESREAEARHHQAHGDVVHAQLGGGQVPASHSTAGPGL